MNGEERLKALRKEMSIRKVDAYIIPHEDQHSNEYIADADARIKFISNFSGSNGIGLVTQEVALMWTDSRYYLQIQKELFPGWEMKKMGLDEETLTQFIKKNLTPNLRIAMDYNLFDKAKGDSISNSLMLYEIVDDSDNMIDLIWKDKPSYSTDKVMIHDVKYTGMTPLEKYAMVIAQIKKLDNIKLKEAKTIRMLISALDDIAWLTNLRGSDISYNPVFFSYAIFEINEQNEASVHLYSNKTKFDTEDIKAHLQAYKITLHDYKELYQALVCETTQTVTIMDSSTTNMRMSSIIKNIKDEAFVVIDHDIIEKIKGIKNETELNGYRSANIKDSAALVKFFAWLENETAVKKTPLDEYQIGLYNKKVREDQPLFIGESFHPICGCGPNSAIIHYHQEENCKRAMTNDQIILCDTGAQYLDGTTDITRTVHNGTPTAREKEMYTRVLLGNLSLQRLMFKPNRKTFRDIDAVTRSFLNHVGEDYGHGTTHGVGHFLNVHEGPYGEKLQAGMVLTNEPGYYETDAFGIRIENEIIVVKKTEELLGFENITFVPYERNLLDYSLISDDMVKFINDFHKQTKEILEPLLKNDPLALDYLLRKTAPLAKS